MLLDDLKELLAKEPFDPFRIRLVNGDSHDVFDPVLFYIYRDGTRCFYATHDGHWVLFTLDRIVSFESLFSESPPPPDDDAL